MTRKFPIQLLIPALSFVFFNLMFVACSAPQDEAPEAQETEIPAYATTEELPSPETRPQDVVKTYWARVSAANLDGAWPLLDRQFQQRHFDNSLERYKADIEASQFCAITIDTVQVDTIVDRYNAMVNARFSIERGDSCQGRRANYTVDLTRDKPEEFWRIRNIRVH